MIDGYPTTHDHPLYQRWKQMIRRCGDPNDKSYPYYGARGISVCKEWHRFANFLEWFQMRNRAQLMPKYLEVDRINPRGSYCPKNCRLVSHRFNSLRCIKRDKNGRFKCHRRRK